MMKYTIEHSGNIKIHFDNAKSVKDYVERFGDKAIKVYKHTVVYDRSKTHIKLDNL